MLRAPVVVFLLAAITLLCSCGSPRYVYAPSLPTPVLTEKGETRLAAFYGGEGKDGFEGSYHRGYELQAAYAFSSHWSVSLVHNQRAERTLYGSDSTEYNSELFHDSDIRYKRRMTQLALGYTQAFGAQKKNFISLQLGAGTGYFHMRESGDDLNDNPYSRRYKSRLLKIFAEPVLVGQVSPAVRLVMTGRISLVRFSERESNFTDQEIQSLEFFEIQNKWKSFFEPSFYGQIRLPQLPWLSAEMGLQFCSDPVVNVVEARSFTPFIGLAFDLGKLNKGK